MLAFWNGAIPDKSATSYTRRAEAHVEECCYIFGRGFWNYSSVFFVIGGRGLIGEVGIILEVDSFSFFV